MKSFKSHTNLPKVGNLVDRSAMSTPISRPQLHSSGPSYSRFLMTPPQLIPSNVVPSSKDAEIATTASPIHPKNDEENDDVFGATDPLRPTLYPSLIPITPHSRVKPEPQLYFAADESFPEYHKRSDELSPDNAQSILPPQALVFVANLPTDISEEHLVQTCTQIFEKFGQCYVTVKRDSRGHPFAFVQYCTEEDALAAIESGKDLSINGRKIRTEKGNARRSVILIRVGGGIIERDEAYEVLSPYGPIENLTPISQQEKTRLGVSEGMNVTFQYVGDYMDTLKRFQLDRANLPYKLMPAPDPLSEQQRHFKTPPAQAPRSTTDQRSIFVGNLPENTEEKDIHEKFEKFGTIMTCNIIRKPIAGGTGFNVFGFVEFESNDQAEAAARQTDVDIRGYRIRVEPKEYSARRNARLGFNRPPAQAYHAPRGRGWGPSHNAPQLAQPMPGFFGLYTQTPYGNFVPVNIPMYGFNPTPPSSTFQHGGQLEVGYMHHGSPQRAHQGHQVHQVHQGNQGHQIMPYRSRKNSNNMQAAPQVVPQVAPQVVPQATQRSMPGMHTPRPNPLLQKRWR